MKQIFCLFLILVSTLCFAQSGADKSKAIADIRNNSGLSPQVKETLINVLSGNELVGCEKEIASGAERIVCADGVYVKDNSVNNKTAWDIIKEAQKAKEIHEAQKKAGQQ